MPVAQVVAADGLDAAGRERLLQELAEQCVAGLSPFKRPADISLVEGFPHASVGKIRRHLVRAAVSGMAG